MDSFSLEKLVASEVSGPTLSVLVDGDPEMRTGLQSQLDEKRGRVTAQTRTAERIAPEGQKPRSQQGTV